MSLEPIRKSEGKPANVVILRIYRYNRGVLLSCKISHSLLGYLSAQGAALEGLDERLDLPPIEFLEDPSSWLEAERMERLLAALDLAHQDSNPDVDLMTLVGHKAKSLHAWGVLDSVLLMFPSAKDIFLQPERFLSYFVTPAPPIGNIQRSAQSIQFEIPIASSEYPCSVRYLCAALEALPTYVSKPMAQVQWEETRVRITWQDTQESLFVEDTEKSNFHPELVQRILRDLEKSQTQVQELTEYVRERDEAVEKLKVEVARSRVPVAPSRPEMDAKFIRPLLEKISGADLQIEQALAQVYRLHDYMTRAQQLITLLVAQGRQTSQVQEAMRRVDWPLVQAEFPGIIKSVAGSLQDVQAGLQTLEQASGAVKPKLHPVTRVTSS